MEDGIDQVRHSRVVCTYVLVRAMVVPLKLRSYIYTSKVPGMHLHFFHATP